MPSIKNYKTKFYWRPINFVILLLFYSFCKLFAFRGFCQSLQAGTVLLPLVETAIFFVYATEIIRLVGNGLVN